MSFEAASQGQDHYNQISKAIEYQKAEKLLKAKNIYCSLLEENPDDANALHLLGMLVHQTGDSDKGAELIEKAVKLLPDFPLFLNNLGHVRLALNQLEKAEEVFTKVMGMDSTLTESMYGLAECYRRKGELQRAADSIQLVLDSDPQHVNAIMSLGQIHLKDGAAEKALELFDIALLIEPENFDTRFHIARAHAALSEHELSIEVLQVLLKERPDHIPCYNNLGNAYMATQQFEKAEKVYQNIVECDVDDVGIRYNLALANVVLNKVSVAIEHLEHGLKISPDNIRLQKLLSDIQKDSVVV